LKTWQLVATGHGLRRIVDYAKPPHRQRALVISSSEVTAIVWIHDGGTRFQLLAPGSSVSVPAALTIANVIEAAA